MHNSVNWCNQCTSSCHEVTSEFFVTNTPSPLHWTLHSCVGALHSVWVHLLSFRNCMKLEAKRGELVQLKQFMPQSHVGIFRNERTQSTPLDPKLMFWCVSWCLGAFWIVLLPHKTWCKLAEL